MACSPHSPVSGAVVIATRAGEAEARLSEIARLIADIAEPEPAPEANITDLPSDLRAALSAWKASHRSAH